MNLLKSVFGITIKDEQPAQGFLGYKGVGRLFLKQKRTKKCIFILSEISFVQGKKDLYDRLIYIVNKSGGSDFKSNEQFFSINENMNLRFYVAKDNEDEILGFEWDLTNGAIACYEFSEDMNLAFGFRHYICHLLYESKYRRSSFGATEEELQSFCREKVKEIEESEHTSMNESGYEKLATAYFFRILDEKPSSKTTHFKFNGCFDPKANIFTIPRGHSQDWKNFSDENIEGRSAGMEELISHFDSRKMSIEKSPRSKCKMFDVCPAKYSNPFNEQVIFEFQTNFCEMNGSGNLVELRSKVNFSIVNEGDFDYHFRIVDENMSLLYRRKIENELNYHVDVLRKAFKWVDVHSKAEDVMVFGCGIPREKLSYFSFVFAQCLFETIRKQHLDEAFRRSEDRDYVQKWFKNDSCSRKEFFHQDSGIEIEEDTENYSEQQYTALSRTQTHDQRPTFSGLKPSKDSELTIRAPALPARFNIMNQNSRKNLLSPSPLRAKSRNSSVVKSKILNRIKEEMIEEVENEEQENSISQTEIIRPIGLNWNYSSRTMNNEALLKTESMIQEENNTTLERNISTISSFNCIAYNGIPGAFATGSVKGEIRLYKEEGQRAKTRFPGFGEPILGLDSTFDGEWLVATTKTYIMLIQTIIDGRNGYKQSITKYRKTPYKLAISLQDMKRYKIRNINFQTAKIKEVGEENEKLIVTSVDGFQVTWSFKNILNGNLDYKIEEFEENKRNGSNIFRFMEQKNEGVSLDIFGDLRGNIENRSNWLNDQVQYKNSN